MIPEVFAKLAAAGESGDARRAALEAAGSREWLPPTQAYPVEYRSDHRVLILGPAARVARCVEAVAAGFEVTAAVTDDGVVDVERPFSFYRANPARLSGYLGEFDLDIEPDGEPRSLAALALGGDRRFSMVIDLCDRSALSAEVKPPGYFHAVNGDEMATVAARLDQYVGEFQKPRYFDYDPDLCAHGSAGLKGCRKCLDACPTAAIISIGEQIEVNPYLCQGGGTCASVCPGSAITYTQPDLATRAGQVRSLIRAYQGAGAGTPAPALLVVSEAGAAQIGDLEALAGHVVPLAVEELGIFSVDCALAAFAWGAGAVMFALTPDVPRITRDVLARESAYANLLCQATGCPARISVVDIDSEPLDLIGVLPDGLAGGGHAGFAPGNDKRTLVRMALDHLRGLYGNPDDQVSLPADAPFGQIRVDREACTLCMACVSVCPRGALLAGGDSPALKFIEWNCVQCGLCEAACPESAIELEARYCFDTDERMSARVLNEDSPFLCVSCGKPFATAGIMRTMKEKLAGHWMFENAEARRRLEMCDDCRVKDMLVKEGMLSRIDRS